MNTETTKAKVMTSGVCSIIITVGLARFSYTPLLPIMNIEAGLSLIDGGWLATFNYIGYIVGALFSSTLKDLKTKFLLYKLLLVASLISIALMGFTTNVDLWFLLRFISGVTSISGMILSSGLIMNWLIRNGFKPELGMHFTGLGIGILISGLAISNMESLLRWDQQWIALTIIGGVFLLPAWFWMPAPAEIISVSSQNLVEKSISKKPVYALTLFYFCTGYGYAIGATFIVSILENLPILKGAGSLIWVFVGIAAIPSSFVWDKISRIINTTSALILANTLETISLVIPFLTDSVYWNIIGALIFGFTFVGIVSLTLAFVGREAPNNPAKSMAKLTISYGIAQIIAPAIAGYLASKYGGYDESLIISAGIMTIGTIVLIFLYFLKLASTDNTC